MQTFTQEYKDQLLEMAAKHRQADEYVKGTYGLESNGKFQACSIGCTIRDVNKINGGIEIDESDHEALAERLLGDRDLCFIPRLADTLFENLPSPLHLEWTERWISAIPADVDPEKLTRVLPRFLLKPLDRLPDTDRADVVNAIAGVREVLQNWAHTGTVDGVAAEEAAGAAAGAAAAEAAAGAAAGAAWAAEEAAEAAAGAAWAAEAAADAAAEAEASEWEQIANDLITCLDEAA